MYSLEQLKIFVSVYEKGSFSAAARKLKRAQSGISQSIANLEIAINQELFNRDKNIPTLTDNGKALLPIARSILFQQQYFDQKVESLSKGYEHELVIAVDESLMNEKFLKILTPLADKFPITQIEIITASSFDIEDLIRVGKVQAGIVYADGELKEDMDFFTLGQACFLTIASPSHALAALPVVQDVDLKACRQIVHRSAKQKELWFSYGISSMVWYASTHKSLVELVNQGVGWASVPKLLVKQDIEQGRVKALPTAHEYNGWLTTVGCLVSRSHSSGPVLEYLINRLNNYCVDDENWKLRDK